MKLFVRVKAGEKIAKIAQIDENHFEVSVKQLPQDGKANEAVIKTIAKHLKVVQNQIKITHGAKSKNKTLMVNQ